MHAHVSLLGIALLPLTAGLIAIVCAPLWRRLFGEERAMGLAGRFALGGTLLAVFLLGGALYGLRVRPDLPPTQPVAWAQVGFTTVLRMDLAIDGLTLWVAGFAVIVALATQMAALIDGRGGAVGLGRIAALLGCSLLLALADSVWAAVVGWQVAMLVVGACGGGRGWARWTDAGAWLAVLAVAIGAGDMALASVTRGALFGVQSALVRSGLAWVAAGGLVVAVVGRALGFAAALRGEPAATRAALHGLAGAAGVLLLIRLHIVLVLAPTVMAVLAVVGGGLAVVCGWAAVRAEDDEVRLGRITQALVGWMLVALGMGAWVPACGLLVGHGLVMAGLVLGGSAARWIGVVSLGLAPIGAGLWIGEIVGAGWMHMSAWSPGLNGVVAVVSMIAAGLLAGAMGHVLRDRSQRTGEGLVAGLGMVLAVLGAAAVGVDMPGAIDGLRDWLSSVFTASWLLQGEFAVGPRPPYGPGMARWGAVVAMVVGWVGFVALRGVTARAVPTVEFAWWTRRWVALVRGLHAIVEGRIIGWTLRPGEVQAARAGGQPRVTVMLVGVLAGALVLLGAVYCNPDVAGLGPSKAYPVDVGGLDPALLGSQRPGGEDG